MLVKDLQKSGWKEKLQTEIGWSKGSGNNELQKNGRMGWKLKGR